MQVKRGYRASRIIDGKSGQPQLASVLVVEGNRIAGIVPEVSVGRDVTVVDLGDCTILPGLIDSHVHLVDDGSSRPRGLVETEPRGMTLLRATQRANHSLRSGVTALRDMGAPTGVITVLKDAARAGVADCPTIVTCDTQLTITGGYGRKENVLGCEVDGADGMRKAIRQLFKNGADFVKLMASGQVSNAGAGLDAAQFTQEEMNAAVDEAHRFGKKVAVHAVGLKSIESSVLAGVDCIEHGNFLTAALAKEMAARGIFLVPTLLPYHVLSHPPKELVLAADVVKKGQVAWDMALNAVRLALEAGVRIGAGTDSGGPCIPHNSVAREIELLAGAGLSPMEAIASATRVNALILGLPDCGTLEAGKLADMVAVQGNPLEDIQAIGRARLVLKSGREIAGAFAGGRHVREVEEGRYLGEEMMLSCRC